MTTLNKRVLMEEAPSPEGESGGAPAPTPAPEATPEPAPVKTILDGAAPEGEAKSDGAAPETKGGETPAPVAQEADYLKALADDPELAKLKDVQVDEAFAKTFIPTLQKHNIPKETYAELARDYAAFQRKQTEAAQEAAKEENAARNKNLQAMNEKAFSEFTRNELGLVSSWGKKNLSPAAYDALCTTELGSDITVLRALLYCARHSSEDSAKGAGAGGGSRPYDPNDISGLADQWK